MNLSPEQDELNFVYFEEVKSVSRKEKLRILNKIKTTPSAIKVDVLHLNFNQWIMPKDDGKPRDRFHLLEEAYQEALPRLLSLRGKFPKEAFISIGMTSNPVKRDLHYNNLSAFYRRDSLSPQLKIEEQILFRTNNIFNALVVEYMLQYHMSDGLWKDLFRCNPQRKLFPALKKSYEKKAHFVYAKFSNIATDLGHSLNLNNDFLMRINEECNVESIDESNGRTTSPTQNSKSSQLPASPEPVTGDFNEVKGKQRHVKIGNNLINF